MAGSASPTLGLPVAITGLGVVSPLGSDVETLYQALASGRSAIAPQADLATTGHRLGARVVGFAPEKLIAPRRMRRLPRLAQMAVVAARQACDDAGLPLYDPARIAVVIGTGLGALDQTVEFLRGYFARGAEGASPSAFPGSVMNAAAAEITIELGLRGYCTTVNHKDASALLAVALAADLLALGRADAVLVGGVDELSPALHHGYRRLGVLSPTAGGGGDEGARPYDLTRNGLVLGEGAVVVILEPAARALGRGARVRGWLAGVALAGDCREQLDWQAPHRPLGAPCHSAVDGAVAAVGEALAQADISPANLGYVAGAANGSLTLDRLEAEVLGQALAGASVPTSSILGASGEWMSSSMLRLASALFAFERRVLPGTTGLTAPDPECLRLLPGLRAEAAPGAPESALVASYATGGADAALVLCRASPPAAG